MESTHSLLSSAAVRRQYGIAALASVHHTLLHLVAAQEARLRSCHACTVAPIMAHQPRVGVVFLASMLCKPCHNDCVGTRQVLPGVH